MQTLLWSKLGRLARFSTHSVLSCWCPSLNALVCITLLLLPEFSFSADWHSSWRARNGGTSTKTQQMQQADLIAKEDAGYYDRIGENRNTYNVTNNSTVTSSTVNNDNRTGSFQETYSVGSLNASTSTISVEGSSNSINADNTARNEGTVNGSISTLPPRFDFESLFGDVRLDAEQDEAADSLTADPETEFAPNVAPIFPFNVREIGE